MNTNGAPYFSIFVFRKTWKKAQKRPFLTKTWPLNQHNKKSNLNQIPILRAHFEAQVLFYMSNKKNPKKSFSNGYKMICNMTTSDHVIFCPFWGQHKCCKQYSFSDVKHCTHKTVLWQHCIRIWSDKTYLSAHKVSWNAQPHWKCMYRLQVNIILCSHLWHLDWF
jgi:hypothetical protein